MSEQTQTARVLEYLSDGGELSGLDALDLFGSYRLSSIIHNLRKAGYNIKTRTMESEHGQDTLFIICPLMSRKGGKI